MARAAEREEGEAQIRVWRGDDGEWRSAGVLGGHKMTVTQLAMSPADELLISVALNAMTTS